MEVLDAPTATPLDSDGDHDRFAHIVSPASAATEAMVTGVPCRAICGKVWVPSRSPERYPLCPECKSAYELITGSEWVRA